jgi:hypothetical protein
MYTVPGLKAKKRNLVGKRITKYEVPDNWMTKWKSHNDDEGFSEYVAFT